MSLNILRLVLSSGAAYENAKLLSDEEMESHELPTDFFKHGEQVGFVADGKFIFMHKDGLDTFQLSKDRPQAGDLPNPIHFDKVLVSGKAYGPGYMCRVHGDELADQGIPEFTYFEQPIVIVTSEGTFMSDASKIHSIILPNTPTNPAQAVRSFTATTHGVRSGRNVPNPYQAVMAHMRDARQKKVEESLDSGAPALTVPVGDAPYPATSQVVKNITTQADLDPWAKEDSEARGDEDHGIIDAIEHDSQKAEEAAAAAGANQPDSEGAGRKGPPQLGPWSGAGAPLHEHGLGTINAPSTGVQAKQVSAPDSSPMPHMEQPIPQTAREQHATNEATLPHAEEQYTDDAEEQHTDDQEDRRHDEAIQHHGETHKQQHHTTETTEEATETLPPRTPKKPKRNH